MTQTLVPPSDCAESAFSFLFFFTLCPSSRGCLHDRVQFWRHGRRFSACCMWLCFLTYFMHFWKEKSIQGGNKVNIALIKTVLQRRPCGFSLLTWCEKLNCWLWNHSRRWASAAAQNTRSALFCISCLFSSSVFPFSPTSCSRTLRSTFE